MIQTMPADSTDKQGKYRKTVPIAAWWPTRVRARLKELGKNQKQFAAELEIGESELTRVLSREVPVLDIIIKISDKLTIAYPVILPDTEPEALHLAQQRRLYRRSAQIDEIAAGVTETPTESQTASITSEHVFRSGERKKARPVATGQRKRRPHGE